MSPQRSSSNNRDSRKNHFQHFLCRHHIAIIYYAAHVPHVHATPVKYFSHPQWVFKFSSNNVESSCVQLYCLNRGDLYTL